MPISVASPVRSSGLSSGLSAVVRVALAAAGRRAGTIGIVLSDDATLRVLNRQWRGIDRATDVLSFPYADDGRRVDGDIVVSMDRAAVQAKRYRVGLGEELARLIVHGALHLAGLDHHRAGDRRHMRARERHAMKAARRWIPALDRLAGSRAR